MNINVEEDADKKADEGELSRIAMACNRLQVAELEVLEAEDALKKAKEKVRALSEDVIPSLCDAAGQSEFKLRDGSKVSVRPYVSTSIAKDKAGEAYTYLRSIGAGDLIKTAVNASFGKGQDADALMLVQYIRDTYELNVEAKPSVHPQTLTAWAKEQMAKGVKLNEDLLGVYIGRKTHITPPKLKG